MKATFSCYSLDQWNGFSSNCSPICSKNIGKLLQLVLIYRQILFILSNAYLNTQIIQKSCTINLIIKIIMSTHPTHDTIKHISWHLFSRPLNYAELQALVHTSETFPIKLLPILFPTAKLTLPVVIMRLVHSH